MPDRRAALGALGLAAAAPMRVAQAHTTASAPRRVGIALGSGGLHGLVHVGAIRAFQQAGVRPAVIAGCSVGAIAGALWAAGRGAAEIEAVAIDSSWRERDRWRMPRLGLADQRPLQQLIERLTDDARIEALEIPFAAVATNLVTGRSEILRSGALAPAVAASASVPIRYEPVEIDGRYLVDGALTAPVPVDAARALGAEVVIALDVASRPYEGPVSGIAGVAFQTFHIMVNQLIVEQLRRADRAIRLDVHTLVQGADSPRALIEAGERAVHDAWPTLGPLFGA
jgi:NTE family protein